VISELQSGYYVVKTINGTMIVEYVKNGHPYPHLVDTVISGPFNDVAPGPMKIAQSGYQLAFQALIEIQKGV
jgi:hypothetical protein